MKPLHRARIALFILLIFIGLIPAGLDSQVPAKDRRKPVSTTIIEPLEWLSHSRQIANARFMAGRRTEIYSTDFEGNQGEWRVQNLNLDSSGSVFSWTTGNANSPVHSWHVPDDVAATEAEAVPTNTRIVSPLIDLPAAVDGQPVTGIFVRYAFDVFTPNAADNVFVHDVWQTEIEVPFPGNNLWHPSTQNAYAGKSWFCGEDSSGTYTANTVQELRTPVLDLSGATGAVVLDFKNFASMENDFDYGYLEVSSDSGRTWTMLDVYSEEKSEVLYNDASYDLTPHASAGTIVRWRFESDDGYASPFGWHLDNLEIKDDSTVYLLDDGGDSAVALVAVNHPLVFQSLHYDYDRFGGGAQPNWLIEDNSTIFNGTLNVVAYAGLPVRFALKVTTDGWNRRGDATGRGFYFDDFAVTATSTPAHDLAVTDLDVPFPNVDTFEDQRAVAQITNAGLSDENAVIVQHSVNGSAPRLSPPALTIPAGNSVLHPFDWQHTGTGPHRLVAMTALSADELRANDTLSVAPIQVYPEGLAELGYDDRFALNSSQITTTTCLVNFSVREDLRGLTEPYNLHRVRLDLAHLTGEGNDDRVRIVVGTASDDTTLADVLLEVVEAVPVTDLFTPHYLNVEAYGLTATHFIVLVDFSVSNGNAGLAIDTGTRFGGHTWFRAGSGWRPSGLGRKMRAWVSWLTPAEIVSIRDIPADQGKQVRVCWWPSTHEGFSDLISHYVLWRRVDSDSVFGNHLSSRIVQLANVQEFLDYGFRSAQPGDRVRLAQGNEEIQGGVWDYITTVPSHPGFEAYCYVAPTLADSNAAGMHWTTFMVSAYDRAGQFIDSEVDSGYSVDNLAPGATTNFVAREIQKENLPAIALTWDENEAEDFVLFVLYKDGVAEPVLRTTGLSYIDTQVAAGMKYVYRLTAVDVNGNEGEPAEASVLLTTVEQPRASELPSEFMLEQNYPNPFSPAGRGGPLGNPATTIPFALPERGHVTLIVFNAMGQEVETLVDMEMQPGFHRVVWRAGNAPSGIYFYRLAANDFVRLRSMVLMR